MLASRFRQPVHVLGTTLLVAFFGLAASTASANCPPGDADHVVLRSNESELTLAYRVILPPDKGVQAGQIPMAEHFVLDVELCADDNFSATQLTRVDATMPEHRHGMNYRPLITGQGVGRFRVEGMMFHMSGHWQISFEVHTGKKVVRITDDVQVN